jgi:hypothetical protein
MSFFRRRLSKSERDRDASGSSRHSISNPQMPHSPPTSYTANPNMMPNGAAGSTHHDSRPASSNAMSDASYDFPQSHGHGHGTATSNPVNPTNTSHRFANAPPTTSPSASRPLSHAIPGTSSGGIGNLSRTDQVVLRYFWEAKAVENSQRDLHFLKFPGFGSAPGTRELIPFCEIYSLVKSSPGAKVVGLGTLGNNFASHGGQGTFIG